MANIPGLYSYVQPGVFSRQRVKQNVNAVGGGLRVALIIGEGLAEESLVISAGGGGVDGVNADFSGAGNPTGRHFQLVKADLVSNRSEVLKNGIPLRVLEQTIDTDPFDSRYDVRVDSLAGRIELQRSHLIDFGGNDQDDGYFYSPNLANVGNGRPIISSDSLVDTNAPSETWTLRCVNIVVDNVGNSISGQARFSLSGSTSGVLKNPAGSPYVWKSDGVVVSNGVLSFSIVEGSAKFRIGDRFTVKVNSGVLNKGDNLTVRYIAESDLNDPELFFSPNDLFAKHGQPSESNTLSLGAQMAFENSAPAIIAIQAMPPVPRKTTDVLLGADNPLSSASEGATGNVFLADTIFPLSMGSTPDADLNVSIFVINPNGTETQLILNKHEFYDSELGSTTSSVYTNFVTGSYVQSYTMIEAPQVEAVGDDGYVYNLLGKRYFKSANTSFAANLLDVGESDLDKQIIVFGTSGQRAVYDILSIGDGYGDNTLAQISLSSGPSVLGSALRYEVVDPNDLGTFFCITDDVAQTYLTAGKGLRIDFVDTRDSAFFDANWATAYEAAELADAQFVVPLPLQTISNIFAAGKQHVLSMSDISNQKERILIIGAINGLTANHMSGLVPAAVEDVGILEGVQGDDAEEVLAGNIEDLANYSVSAAYGDTYRVVYMGPDQIVRNISGTNTILSGYFMAPAMAGFLSGLTDLAEPPTYKTLAGFNIPRSRTYRPQVLNQLGAAGVLVVQPIAGGGRILHGKTTSYSGAPEDEELSIVAIRDQVVRTARATLRPFIGKASTPTILNDISGGMDKLFRSFVSQGLLSGYTALSVFRDLLEPRQINVSATLLATAPVNWIMVDVVFSI